MDMLFYNNEGNEMSPVYSESTSQDKANNSALRSIKNQRNFNLRVNAATQIFDALPVVANNVHFQEIKDRVSPGQIKGNEVKLTDEGGFLSKYFAFLDKSNILYVKPHGSENFIAVRNTSREIESE